MKQNESEINSNFDSFVNEKEKRIWKKSYTWVLMVNAAYIIVFYLLMKFL